MPKSQYSFGSALAPYFVAILATIGAVALRWLIDPLFENGFRLIFLYGAVAFSVWYSGYLPALLAAVLGYGISNYLFMGEPHTLDLSQETVTGFVAYLISCSLLIGFGEAARRANRQIVERDETLQVTLSSVVDAVIATDEQGRVTRMNETAASLTGWAPDAALGLPITQVLQLIDASTGKAVDALLADPSIKASAHSIRNAVLTNRNKVTHLITGRAVPFRHEPTATGRLLIFRDVSEEQRREELLLQNERELTDFFDNAIFGIHWVGPDGEILRANQAELDLLGYSRDEYVGRQITDFHVDTKAIEGMLERVQNGEVLREYPAQLRRKDGGIEHVLISCNALFDHGKFVHSRCFTRVITDRKQAEEARARLAAIVAASDDAIVSKSLDGIILSWNAGAERIFGYSEKEMIGKPINTIIPPHLQDEEVSIISRIRTGERVRSFETVRQTKDGRHIDISVTVSPMFDDAGRVIGASKVARDITERKQTEKALQEADQRKDEFLATLAHELRNPLAPISNSLEILKHADHNADLLHRSRETIERQLTHMVRLVDDLLNISRISQDKLILRPVDVELSAIVQQAVETATPVIEKFHHTLTVELPDEPVYLHADPVRLSQVFSNLLNNACKYTEPGGNISLTAKLLQNGARIGVKDNGIGIQAEQLDAIFDMFGQAKTGHSESLGGLGIGLTLAKRLVEMHDGQIAAFSEGPGHGSEIVVHLPVITQVNSRQPEPQHMHDVSVAPRRVLVVDDNIDGADSLAILLRLSGHKVQLAHDGVTAIELAEEFRPDVLLLDIGLPKLDGYDVCRRIRALPWGKAVTIAALTGWGQEQDQRKSREAGFDAHLVKPVNYADIIHLIQSNQEAELDV